MGRRKLTMQQLADRILKEATKQGIHTNFFFTTTFKRYTVQLGLMERLEKLIAKEGMLVEKEYVKGRKNLTANPAISEYNKTASAANGTVSTLLQIMEKLSKENADEHSKLQDLIKGINADE